jgi:oligoendopeptidase F
LSAGTTTKRGDIPEAFKWDLSHIYPDWERWHEDVRRLQEAIDHLERRRGAELRDAWSLRELLVERDALRQLFERVWWYPTLIHDEDLRRNEVEARKQKVQILHAKMETATAWIRPQLLSLPWSTVARWLEEDGRLGVYRFALEDLFRQKDHILDEDGERLLSYAARLSGGPPETYALLSTADTDFETVELTDGRRVRVTPSAYHHLLQTETEQEDRRRAFQALYEVFHRRRNTYASLYSSVCERDWFHARSRGYPDTLSAALDEHAVPTSVVENLIATTREETSPLRRSLELRRRILRLDEIHLYDGFIPLLRSEREYPFEQARHHVLDSVDVLGEDYRSRMREILFGGWIDVYENEGKRSGAYSAPVFGVHPYMLLNYKDTLSDLFTLAHEMGHSMHTALSHRTQPYVYAHYTIFVAEVASTLNETLLLDHLLEQTNAPRERILLLQRSIDLIVSTFYAQVLFADFELQAHRRIEAGEPLTADILEELYGNLLDIYYGDAIVKDDLYRCTWARIPHLYRSPYYVYQYATCFASAASLKRQLSDGVPGEREVVVGRYLDLLRSGGSAQPMDQLRAAGVDLRRPQTVAAVPQQLNGLLDELEDALARI